MSRSVRPLRRASHAAGPNKRNGFLRFASTRRGLGTLGAAVATVVMAATLVSIGVSGASGVTQIVVAAFTGPTNGIAEATTNNWSVSGNTASTNNSLPVMVDGPDSDTDVDRLRLTSTSVGGATGYALYDVAQTTSSGLDISFNLAISGSGGTGCPTSPADNYNATSTGGANSGNSCQADGFAFYLKDGANTDTGAASLGSPGGSLGYAPLNTASPVNGLSGALLGIGFDAYGNFYQQPYGGSGCSSDPSQSTTQYARRSLIVRGPQTTSRQAGFCRVATDNDRTLSSRNIGVDISSSGIFSAAGAAVRVTIDTTDTSGSRTNGTGKVYIASAGTTNWSGITPAATFTLPQTLHDAQSFKFGFVAGTGGGTMNTDIWSTSVSSIRDIPDPVWVTPATLCVQSGVAQSVQMRGDEGVAPYSFSLQSGSLPSGLSLATNGLLTGTSNTTGSGQFTLRLTDNTSPTHRTVDQTFSYTVRSGECATKVSWTINSASAGAPSDAANDGSCSSGTYSQSTVDGYRIAKFMAPASGDGSCTWSAPTGVTQFEVLAVGGGGGGGYDAGGGGGGGATVLQSAWQSVSGQSASITVGAGGAKGTSGSRAGSAGHSSVVTYNSTTLTANAGGGGKDCSWNGTHCASNGTGNVGGTGGVASGGTQRANGANGGRGVWTGSTSNFPQNGGDGTRWQTSGTTEAFGGGGGGSGASKGTGTNGAAPVSTGGAGGGGGGSMTSAASTAGTAGTGGGGGGGNGEAANGGSGVVYIRYALTQASNAATITVSANVESNLTISTAAVVAREYTTLTDSTCGTVWQTETGGVGSTASPTPTPTASPSMALTGGRCYRWTVDNGLDNTATRPVDSAGASPTANLTSPILVVPATATLTAPTVIPVDPRATTIDLPGLTISGPAQTMVCLYQASSGATLGSGIGVASSSPTLSFDVATIGTTDTLANSTGISGDRSGTPVLSGTRANVGTSLASVRVSSTSALNASRYVLVRAVPVVTGFTSTCTSVTAGLGAVNAGTRLVELRPLDLGTSKNVTVPVG